MLKASDDELSQLSKDRSLGLSIDEMKSIRDYFKKEGRNPVDVELEAFAQSWSEHCCYKSSKNILKDTIFAIKSPDVICAISEDAAVVDFEGEYAYVVKIESHNHPSALDPYGGAATGVGGVLRDIVCMGAQPIALVDQLFFGPLNLPEKELPKGVKHPRYLFNGVVSGIADYGNRVGIPTVAGQVSFDKSYIGNCLVNAGCIGMVKKDKVVHSRVGGPGDMYILAGGKTGRDGIHGVTFASQELHDKSEDKDRAAVQLGYAIMKEPLMHACLEANEKGLLTGLKDFGGGGLSCVSSEMAHAAGCGATIYLDKIPLKEPDVSPWEIWVSESQERMMLSVKKEDVDKVLEIFSFWDVLATVVGEVDDSLRIKATYKGVKVLDLDLEMIIAGVCYNREKKIIEKKDTKTEFKMPELTETCKKMLALENIASKEGVVRRYDHEVRAATVIKPMQGKVNTQTHGDATVLKPLDKSYRGLAVSCDVNPTLCRESPYWGAASAVDEAIRNLAAINAKAHSIVDCLNFANPEKPERLGDFKQAVEGMHFVAKAGGIPFVSGNVSLYNESNLGPIAPTPTLMTLGIAKDVRKCVTSDFKVGGNTIYLIGETKEELRGSQYQVLSRFDGGIIPKVNPEKTLEDAAKLMSAMDEGLVSACHDLSEGGVYVALAEMCFGGDLGAEVDLAELGSLRTDVKLFSESNGRWLVEVKKGMDEKFNSIVNARKIGKVMENGKIKITDNSEKIELDVAELKDMWDGGVVREVPK
ncbi:MAG: phosphoribosylformylglycinamidine synthase subunit PurL [Candidatus Altiarchaeota archaeon]|nr:phosphoribosylformylglycinamidine synthase subunit PurL [Candidatus Altiarchaeota archaeon]